MSTPTVQAPSMDPYSVLPSLLEARLPPGSNGRPLRVRSPQVGDGDCHFLRQLFPARLFPYALPTLGLFLVGLFPVGLFAAVFFP